MKFGCHVSIAGGVDKAPANAGALGCEVFQIFTRSPRGGPAPVLSREKILNFRSELKKYDQAESTVHTPYYINFGSKNPSIARASSRIVREELERASALGCSYVMTHLGSYKDLGKQKGFAQLTTGLADVLRDYRGDAILLLENSAGAGEQMGGTFEELAEILADKKLKRFPIGVCLDTCHTFASGYDLRSDSAVRRTIAEFDRTIGLDRLKVIHANDSKLGLGDHRDRHEHIGRGKIGSAGFRALVRHPKLQKVNMYLETEHDAVREDLMILKKMRG